MTPVRKRMLADIRLRALAPPDNGLPALLQSVSAYRGRSAHWRKPKHGLRPFNGQYAALSVNRVEANSLRKGRRPVPTAESAANVLTAESAAY